MGHINNDDKEKKYLTLSVLIVLSDTFFLNHSYFFPCNYWVVTYHLPINKKIFVLIYYSCFLKQYMMLHFFVFYCDNAFWKGISFCSYYLLYSNLMLLWLKVLSKHYPEVMMNTPSVGRKGKALRRQHHRRAVESQRHHEMTSPHAVKPEDSETGTLDFVFLRRFNLNLWYDILFWSYISSNSKFF